MSDTYIAPHKSINQAYTALEALFETWATMISRDGVFIRCREPFCRGTRVSLRFAVAMETIYIIAGEGTVVRSDYTTESGMEVRFETLTHDSHAILTRVLREDAVVSPVES